MLQNTFIQKEDAPLLVRHYLLIDALALLPIGGATILLLLSYYPKNIQVKRYARSLLVLELFLVLYLVFLVFRYSGGVMQGVQAIVEGFSR